MGGVVSSVFDTVGDVVESVVDVVEDVVDGVGDFVGDVGEAAVDAVSSPIGQIAVSIAFPQYAAYINSAAKVANGQDLNAFDFVSLGIQGYSDLNAGVKVPANVQKAARTAARIADGADPVTALVGAYGADFVKETGLADSLKNTIGDVVGQDAYNFIENNMNLDQAAADLFAGEDPLRILSNQFGDEVVNYIAADDPNMQALGFSGIETLNALNEGVDPEKAILRGAQDYYRRGGELPDIGELGSMTGIDIPDLGLGDFLSEIGQGIGDLLPDMSFEGLKNLKDLGWDLGNVDFKGFDFGNIEGIDLPKLGELGLNIENLDINMPQLKSALAYQGLLEQGGGQTAGVATDQTDPFDFFKRTTDNELLFGDESSARKLLETPMA